MSERISVCIVCCNEADRLGPCLDSAAWADEILVMDLESEDDSGEVARRHGARVFTHGRVPIVELVRNTIAEHATGTWILALDPDERITPGLAQELRRLAGRDDLDAVAIPSMNHDFGSRPTPELHRFDSKPRMYRRGRIQWPELPNELPKIDPQRLATLPNRVDLVLVHERNRTIAEALERVVRYAPAEADAMIARGEIFTARRMITHLRRKANKQFVVGEPWRDGAPGLIRAFVLFAFHVYVWVEFWQKMGSPRTEQDDQFVARLALPLRGARLIARLLRRIRRTASSVNRGRN